MTGTFSPPLRVSNPVMHHDTCVTHVPWCMSGSLTGGFLWIRWRGKRSRHSRRMRNPQFYWSGKKPMVYISMRASVLRPWRRITFRGSMIMDAWWRALPEMTIALENSSAVARDCRGNGKQQDSCDSEPWYTEPFFYLTIELRWCVCSMLPGNMLPWPMDCYDNFIHMYFTIVAWWGHVTT